MRKLAFIIFLVPFLLKAQSTLPPHVADSLFSIWKNPENPDSIRGKAMRNYVWNGYLFSQPDSAFYFANEYQVFAHNKGLLKQKADALNIKGISYVFRSSFDEALSYYYQALEINLALDYKRGIADSYNNIGMVYSNQNNSYKSIDYHTKSLKIREEIGYKKGMASSLGNIGNVHKEQENYALAIEFLEKSLTVFNELNEKRSVSIALENIGLCYQYSGNFKKALGYFEECLKLSEELGDTYGIAASYVDLSMVYQDMNEDEKSMEYNLKGLELYNSMGNIQGASIALGNIGFLYLKKKKYKEAIEHCLKAIEYADQTGGLEQAKNSYSVMYEAYKALGDNSKTLHAFEKYIAARDSIVNERAKVEVIKQQTKYEYEKQKALDDVSHQKELAIQNEEKEKQQILTYSIALGLTLVLIFLIIVYNRFKITQKQKLIIEETNEELNQTNEELAAQRDEIANQKNKIETAHQEIKDSIDYAKRIQNAILPTQSIIKGNLPQSFVMYLPKDVVAGDFYWLEKKNNDVLFAVADCTGHGVPGAMVSVVCNNGLNRSVREHSLTDPAKILDKTREIVLEEFSKSEEDVQDGMDIAVCNLSDLELSYSGANNPLWIIRNNEVLETKANKQPIGKYRDPKPFTTHKINLEKGDVIYIFTDGYADQFGGPKGKKMGYKKLREKLLSISTLEMSQQKVELESYFKTWKGQEEQIDDVCLMGVKIGY